MSDALQEKEDAGERATKLTQADMILDDFEKRIPSFEGLIGQRNVAKMDLDLNHLKNTVTTLREKVADEHRIEVGIRDER